MAGPKNLTLALQKELDKIKSPVRLSATNDGTWPEEYAFRKDNKDGRDFHIEFADSDRKYSMRFTYVNYEGQYDHCYGRVIFNRVWKLALAVDLWVDKGWDIKALQDKFKRITVFEPFEFVHEDPVREAEWVRAQNRLFNRGLFWREPVWEARYNEMLLVAKKREDFKYLFPFMSMWWFRFSREKGVKGVWPLDLYITPTAPGHNHGFIVGFIGQHEDGSSKEETLVFDNIHEALDFYTGQLEKTPMVVRPLLDGL